MAIVNDKIFTAMKSGELWVQPNGPNTKVYLLGCHELGDLAAPEGEITKIYCLKDGQYVAVGDTQAPPGNASFQVSGFLPKTRGWIEKMRCYGAFYVIQRDCGRSGLFTNYTRMIVATNARRSNTVYGGLVRRSADAEGVVQATFTADVPLINVAAVTGTRQSSTLTEALNDVSACNVQRCAGTCGEEQEAGQYAFAVSDFLAGSPSDKADTINTEDGGTWTAGAVSPFAGGFDIKAGVCFEVGTNTIRHLVGRGTTIGGTPAQVMYSDDDGATWSSLISVGSTNAQYFTTGNSIFALDIHNLWAVTTGGYIYYSEDGGGTWSVQESGSITVQPWNAVHFCDENYGIAGGGSNTLAKTTDGGDTWTAMVAPAARAGASILSVCIIDKQKMWISYSTGYIYYTVNGGTDWVERSGWTNAGSGSVPDIRFLTEYVGWMVHNTTGPVGTVLRTFNGGYDWEPITTPTNAGLNAIAPVDENTCYAVGEVYGGTAMVIKVEES